MLAMKRWDDYRVRAAELHARAACENDPASKTELESLARSYLRLAEQAEQNSRLDLTYETPLPGRCLWKGKYFTAAVLSCP